ncbi:MAG: hypothetical protein QNI96_05125 [Woeseiaceae bacterium]|nr:hypothetical protein [Woeseiaceae bacterium]
MMTVTPAYGRDYTSSHEAKASWYGGQDWIVADVTSRWDGKPVSLNDLKNAGVDPTVKLRFDKLRRAVIAS